MNTYTIDAFVNQDTLEGLRLIAGEKARNNVISNVNIIDNPDTFDWLSAGDFLLTTGYIFKDSPQMQLKLVRELSDIGCAGLGIKTKRYMDMVPEVMIEEANRCGFPIVEIPFRYSLANISNVINNALFKREDTMLKKLINIHDKMMGCVLMGGGVDELVAQTSALISNPVILVDSKWRLLSYKEHPDNTKRLQDYIPLAKKERAFPREFISDIPYSISEFTKSIKRRFPNEEGEIICRILPVAANKTIYGYLVVWESVSKMQFIDYMAMESAASSIAMERIKTRQMEEMRHHMRQDFFDELLSGKIESVSAVNSLAEIHNMNPQKAYVCVVTRVSEDNEHYAGPHTASKDDFNQLKERLLSVIESVAYTAHRNVVSIHRGNLLLSFCKVGKEDQGRKASQFLREFVEDIYHSLVSTCPELRFQIGVGSVCSEFLEMKKTYMQAQEAIKISTDLKNSSPICYFDDMIIYHFLETAVSREALQDFYDASLRKLSDYDEQNHTDLVETLNQYFLCNGIVSVAAKKMFLHRNTLIYRMEKIKDILGSELNDPQELLQLQIGLKIMKILKDIEG